MRAERSEEKGRRRNNGLYLCRLVGRLVNTVVDMHHEVSLGDC